METEGTFSSSSVGAEWTTICCSAKGTTFSSFPLLTQKEPFAPLLRWDFLLIYLSSNKKGPSALYRDRRDDPLLLCRDRRDDPLLLCRDRKGLLLPVEGRGTYALHGEKITSRFSVKEDENLLHLVMGWEGSRYSVPLWRRRSLFFAVGKGEEDVLLLCGEKRSSVRLWWQG